METGRTGLLIDGQWQAPSNVVTVWDKYTQQEIAKVAVATPADVDRAITGAQAASRTVLPAARRQEILLKAADFLVAEQEEIVALYIAETGFTRTDAVNELKRTADLYRLCAGEAVRIAGEEIPVAATPGSENRMAFTTRVPVGIVGAIAPFNAPLSTVAHKVGPALAAGNAVVLKPAEVTPLCAMAVADIFQRAGLPAGYLQVVCGSGRTTGDALVRDNRIRFFTFTGSTAVGRMIKANSGIARVHLELGANSASIVANDADLDLVARLATKAGYRKAGQVCTSVQRLLVERGVFDELTEKMRRNVGALRFGDPRAQGTDVGPMIAAKEAERAASWIAEARRGNDNVLGGQLDGSVLEPALIIDPLPDIRLLNEEAFAPVVTLVPVDSVDQAVQQVNDGQYGLQTGLFTRDLDRAFHAAKSLQVGGVIINDTSSYHVDSMPYGGVKDSGIGVEGPKFAVQDMTDPKLIVLNLNTPKASKEGN
ncbi:aldehyde dehydrogenase family protein [Arthrobacter sp. NPDC080031]|uniref:aldehyde dehydrogenase family protein n=1 Tax=Arthrobacter sp. NPDC080031 TaxID=3155918 RepID=UPI00345016D8